MLAPRSLILFTSLLLTSCVNNRQLDKLQTSLDDLRGLQAEQTTEIANLREESRELRGRLEELEHTQDQRLGKDLTSLRDDLSTLKRRVPPPPIVPVAALDADEARIPSLPSDMSQPFSEGLLKIREGDFPGAVPILQAALDSSYGPETAGYVLFWLGVANDGLKDNKAALQAYNELVSKYPKHPRAASGLLRQSAVFARLGDKSLATLTLKKLVADFPKSAEAVEAKEKLKS